jgi:4-amino-4-deoxy-L-arabinose transferase-like glycosyltransferase
MGVDSQPVSVRLARMDSILARLAVRPFATILVLGLVLLQSGNWILPLVDRDEPRFAEASREMRQRRDWVVPRFNGQYRFDKPPLIYWCQAACYHLFGESAWAARLPSACFGTGTALLLIVWGRRLGNERAGFYAALMWITCLQVLIHGRMAVADMAMLFFFTAASWTGWETIRPAADRPWTWRGLFIASLALGFLAKGPVIWLPIGGLALARWWWSGAFRLSWFWLPAALGASLALISLWAIPALVATNGEFFRVGIGHHVIYRSFDVMEGHGARGWLGYCLTLPLYFVTFFLSFFPWALGVPSALARWWPARRDDPHGGYLLVQAGVVFGVFSLVRTKLPHYTLPAFPCLALWLGCQATRAAGSAQLLTRGVLAMTALTLTLTLGVFSVARPRLIAANLWREIRPHARPETKLAVVGFGEPSLVWECRQTITNYPLNLPIGEAARFIADPGPRVLVVPSAQADEIAKGSATNTIRVQAAGFDTVQFKRHDLTAIIRP